MKIYISTGLNRKIETSKLIRKFAVNKIKNIELSGGIYEKDIINKLNNISKINLLLHNYFPVPKYPFIINLASHNNKIYNQSINHLKKAISYSSKLKLKYFSFHAGFLVDPKVDDIGQTLSKQITNDRDYTLNLFIVRLNELSKYAKKKGVMILIENNVITKKNLNRFSKNPFLMTRVNESRKIMLNTDSNVKLLVDVAHLKVSSKTLKFSPINYLKKLDRWIEAYHLSDNYGDEDSNLNLSSKSWFWRHLKSDVKFCTLELKDLTMYNIKSQLKLCKKKFKTIIT